MIIESYDNQYLITKSFHDANTFGIEHFIYKELEEEIFYKVARQKNDYVNGEEIKFLMDQMKNESFTDFVEYFTDSDYLYILMNYNKHITLKQKIETENCTLNERLQIGKNIMEAFIILDMPIYFQFVTTNVEAIFVSQSLEIEFDYNLSNILDFSNITIQDSLIRMAKVLSILFQDEIKLKGMRELDILIYKLTYNEYFSMAEIYKEYYVMYKKYLDIPKIQPKNKKFKLWAIFKKIAKVFSKLIKLLVIAVVILYLVVSIQTFFKEHEKTTFFETIGTINIIQESMDETTVNP